MNNILRKSIKSIDYRSIYNCIFKEYKQVITFNLLFLEYNNCINIKLMLKLNLND